MQCVVAVLFGASVGALAFATAPAFAYFIHTSSPTYFAGTGTDALSNPTGVAVDSSSGPSDGDVYVTDPANHRVEKFGPAGEFILMFGKEVNETPSKPPEQKPKRTFARRHLPMFARRVPVVHRQATFASPAFVAVDNSAAGEGDSTSATPVMASFQNLTPPAV